MIHKQRNRILKTMLFSVVSLIPAMIIAVSELTSVSLSQPDPCKRVAAIELRQIDAGAQLGVLAGQALLEARQASAGVYDYLRDTTDMFIKEGEAQAIWGAKFPVKHPMPLVNLQSISSSKDIAISGDSTIVAIASGSDGLIVYYGNSFKHFPIALFNNGGGADSIETVAIHPNRPWIVVGSSKAANSHAVEGIDLSNDNPETWVVSSTLLTTPFHPDEIKSVRFSPDGGYLGVLGKDQVKVVNVGITFGSWVDSSNFSTTAPTKAAGHIAWKQDSSGFAIITDSDGTDPRTVHYYGEAITSPVRTLVGTGLFTGTTPVLAGLSFNHDGRKLAIIYEDKVTVIDSSDIDSTNWTLFDIDGAGNTEITITTTATPVLSNVVFHPQVDFLAATDTGAGDLHIFDLRSSKPFKNVGSGTEVLWKEVRVTDSGPTPGYLDGLMDLPYILDGDAVRALAWTKSGNQMILASPQAGAGQGIKFVFIDTSNDDYLKWSTGDQITIKNNDNTEAHTLGNNVNVSSLSPDGKWLLTKDGTGGLIVIWDLVSGDFKPFAYTGTLSKTVRSVAWSPDSQYIFIAHTDTTEKVIAYDIDDFETTVSPVLAKATYDTSVTGTINSLAVTKTAASAAGVDYYIAIGLDAKDQAHVIGFDGSAFSSANLADGTNDFALHVPTTPGAGVVVAMQGSWLATAGKGDATATNIPEIKIWNLEAFVGDAAHIDINTAPTTPQFAARLIEGAGSGSTSLLAASTRWHAAAKNITTLDLHPASTHVVSGDNDGRVYITDISGFSISGTTAATGIPRHVDVNPTQYAKAGPTILSVNEVKFSKTGGTTALQIDGLCRLIVKLSGVDTATTGTDGDIYVYDAANLDGTTLDDFVTNGSYDPIIHSFDSTAITPGLDLISPLFGFHFHQDRMVFVRAGEAHIQPFNRLAVAMAQIIKDQINSGLSVANNFAARNSARTLVQASGIDLTVANNSTALNIAIDAAIGYLLADTTQNDITGAAQLIIKNLTSYVKPDDLDFAKAAVNRFVRFSNPAPGIDSTHLVHPRIAVAQDRDSFVLSGEKVLGDADRIYRVLRNQLGTSNDNATILTNAAPTAEHEYFKSVARVADQHGLAQARYAATLAHPEDGKDLGTVAYDHITEFKHLGEVERTTRASKELTEHLRRLGKTHYDDRLCRGVAQQVQNYINFGRDLIDCMGILPADKAGVAMRNIKDMAWSHDGRYLFVAAEQDGLLVFDKDGCFIKHFASTDFTGSTSSAVTVLSVSTHPTVSFLVVGTDAAPESVQVINFTSDDPEDWKIYRDTIQSGAQVGISSASVNFKLMVRFSPDGTYLALSGDDATDNEVKFAAVQTNSLDTNSWIHASADWGGTPGKLTATGQHETVIAWSHDSTKIARVTNTDEIKIATTSADTVVGGGSLFTASIKAMAFNHDGTKLAVLHDESGGAVGTAQTISILNATALDTTTWAITKTFDLTNVSTPSALSNVQWHPTRNILVVNNGSTVATAPGLRDVHVFDLQHASSSKWFEYDADTHGGIFPLILDPTQEPAINHGIAWSKDGTKFAVGSHKLTTADNKGDIGIIKAGLVSNPNTWTLGRAHFNYNEGTRLSLGVFDALRDDPTNATAGKNVDYAKAQLLGIELDGTVTVPSTTDYTGATALKDQIVAGFETAAKDYYVDITKAVPIALTKHLRYSIEQNAGATKEINAAGAAGGTGGTDGVHADLYQDNIVTTATAAALVGSGYAKKATGATVVAADILAPNDTIQFITKLVKGKLAKDNTDLTILPFGDLESLCGKKLDQGVGSGVGGGRYNGTGSTLGGPYETIGSYLDALKVDVLSKDPNSTVVNPPLGGLIEENYASHNLTKNEKEALARAIQLRVLLSGDEAATRTYFEGSGPKSTLEIADVVKDIMQSTLSLSITTKIPFNSLDVSVKQEMVAVALLYYGNTTASYEAIVDAAYDAATHVAYPVADIKKLNNIRRHMVVLGALAYVASVENGGMKTDIGAELARGLLKGEQIKNLVFNDFGSSGSDGICVDLSNSLLSAVSSIIALEELGSVLKTGSFAAALAYNQLFNDSLYHAIAKFGRNRNQVEFAKALALNSAVSGDPTVSESEEIAKAALSTKETKENHSRSRKKVQEIFESKVDIPTTSPAPEINHTVNGLLGHFQDVLKNPTSFVLNLHGYPLFSNVTEPRTGTTSLDYGHPENMGSELVIAPGITSVLPVDIAQDVYTYLCDSTHYDQVEAAAAHCDHLLPGTRLEF